MGEKIGTFWTEEGDPTVGRSVSVRGVDGSSGRHQTGSTGPDCQVIHGDGHPLSSDLLCPVSGGSLLFNFRILTTLGVDGGCVEWEG